ncbi:MAG: hypothetical protein AAF846_16865 [Chloroflexota bacterium]
MTEVTLRSQVWDSLKGVAFLILCLIFDAKTWVAITLLLFVLIITAKVDGIIIEFLLNFFSINPTSFQAPTWLSPLFIYTLLILGGSVGFAGLLNCFYRFLNAADKIENQRLQDLRQHSEDVKELEEQYERILELKKDFIIKCGKYSVEKERYNYKDRADIEDYLTLINNVGIKENNSKVNILLEELGNTFINIKGYLNTMNRRYKINLFDLGNKQSGIKTNQEYEEAETKYKNKVEKAKISLRSARLQLEIVESYLQQITLIDQKAAERRLRDNADASPNVLTDQDENPNKGRNKNVGGGL